MGYSKKDKFLSMKNELEKEYYESRNDVNLRDLEKEIEVYLKTGIINEIVVAWKTGKIKQDGNVYLPIEKEGCYYNGYGKKIDKTELIKYLNSVNTKWETLKDEGDFKTIYQALNPENAPDNFGAVYIINLIYFKSKMKWPIYDKFAHMAIKSIYMEKEPWEVYVGDAPGKKEINKVVNMYSEYIWLLEKVFDKKDISRDFDRALWAYGHHKCEVKDE